MAKQKGLHKLAGKVDEQSYYYSKNGGYQSRKINPGIGERVKSAPEYFNTRLNNAEFGAAGACAGAMIREVTKRWRYILDSIATGKMVKKIKALMEQDTTSPWGQRVVALADMPSVQDAYTRFSKNQMYENIVSWFLSETVYDSTSSKIKFGNLDQVDLLCGSELANELSSIGATGIRISTYALSVKAPEFSQLTHGYLPSGASIEPIISTDSMSVESTDEIFYGGVHALTIPVKNTISFIAGLLVVVEPLKEIASQKYVLQQHCSALWFSVPSGTVQ